MEKKLLSVIIPVFNEENTIEKVIDTVSIVKLPVGWFCEIVIVDDASTDTTRQILNKYKNIYKVIFRSKNGGKGIALRDGFKEAEGDYILIQDADLEYDPNDYIKLLEPITKGESDIVFGSRILGKNNIPFSRIYFFGGIFLTKVFNLFFGTKLTDVSTCYKVFHKKYIEKIMEFHSNDFVFDFAELTYVLISNGVVLEVPISYNPRSTKNGKKLKVRHGILIFLVLIKLYYKNIVQKFY